MRVYSCESICAYTYMQVSMCNHICLHVITLCMCALEERRGHSQVGCRFSLSSLPCVTLGNPFTPISLLTPLNSQVGSLGVMRTIWDKTGLRAEGGPHLGVGEGTTCMQEPGMPGQLHPPETQVICEGCRVRRRRERGCPGHQCTGPHSWCLVDPGLGQDPVVQSFMVVVGVGWGFVPDA